MTRYFGIDYGAKRIGLAVGDDQARIASPVATVAARGSISDHVAAVLDSARDYEADAFVVGLPTNMDGTEGKQAKLTRSFAGELSRQTGKPVHFADERLSSRTAQELIQPADLTRRKRKSVEDAVAAQVILQSFLDSLPT